MSKYLQNKSNKELRDMVKDISVLNNTQTWPEGKIPVWSQEMCDENNISPHMQAVFLITAVGDEVMNRFINTHEKI